MHVIILLLEFLAVWAVAGSVIRRWTDSWVVAIGGGFIAMLIGGAILAAVINATSKGNSEDEACRQDLRCWAEEHQAKAERACRPEIADLARIDVRWHDEFLLDEFSKFKWADEAAGTVMYFGDRVQFQNAQGAWVRHRYSCTYDPATETVQRVRAEAGRIPSS